MNFTLSSANSSCPELYFANFNQDCGCFVVGTSTAFRVYNCDPLRLKESQAVAEDKGVVCAELLFRCNYVAVVCAAQPKAVKIWDEIKKRAVITLDFSSEVRAVRLRRDKIVVVLSNMIKVFSFTSSPQQMQAFETCANPRGLCSLSPSSTNSLMAFPSPETGKVQLVDLANPEKPPVHISAHETKLSCITINVTGCRLATASDKGTLIRIFNTEDRQLLIELRRGSQPATIYSINFSSDSSLLCASSSNGTIHIFAIDDHRKNKRSSLASNNFLPTSKLLPKYFSSEWSFSRIEIPGGTPCICAFGSTNNSIIAVCADGSYHKFVFDKGTFARDVYQMFLDVSDT